MSAPTEVRDDRPLTEEEKLYAWRVECFLKLGYDWAHAIDLALACVDSHRPADLIAAGASLEEAYHICL